MKRLVSLDHAGRVVIPKWARDQLGLRPGQPLELISAVDELRLRPRNAHAAVVRAPDGSLVFVGEPPPGFDNVDIVDRGRDERSRSLWEKPES